jgi:hypothetical protein
MKPADSSGSGAIPFWLAVLRCSAGPSVCIALLAMCLSAQATAQANNSPTFRAETSLVLVPALVTTSQGKVVFGLREKDFLVTDNGVEQKVMLDESYAGRPVSLVIAVQRGGRAPEVLGGGCPPPGKENVFTRQAVKCTSPLRGIGVMLETFLHDSGSEVALVSFDSHVRLRQNFTAAIDDVTRELESLPAGDGGSAILDTMQYSLQLLRQSPEDHRRVLIVVSEEVDRGSSRVTLEDAARQIAATNTEIYMIAIADPDANKETVRMVARLLGPALLSMTQPTMGGRGGGTNGTGPLTGAAGSMSTSQAGRRVAKNSSDQSNGDDDGQTSIGPGLGVAHAELSFAHRGEQKNIPRTVANLTGGEYVLFSDARGLDEALGLLANHAHNRYELSYRVKSSQPGLHRISVRLREPMEVQVAARTSYWQPAPDEHAAVSGSLAK